MKNYFSDASQDNREFSETDEGHETAIRTELHIDYDNLGNPISAKCTRCGRAMDMPSPNQRFTLPGDIILWFSEQFLRHKRISHPRLGA